MRSAGSRGGIWARLGVADHPDAASAEQGLARIFRIQGRLDEALAAIERAVEIRSVLGEHPLLGSDLHYLGEILLARGEPERAVEPLRRSVAIPPGANGDEPERALAGRRLDLARALAARPEGRAEARALAERPGPCSTRPARTIAAGRPTRCSSRWVDDELGAAAKLEVTPIEAARSAVGASAG